MSHYKKGRRFEYKVKNKLEQLGIKVFRLAASKPYDLLAFSKGVAFAIECKNYKITSKTQMESLFNNLEQQIEGTQMVPLVIDVNIFNKLKEFIDKISQLQEPYSHKIIVAQAVIYDLSIEILKKMYEIPSE